MVSETSFRISAPEGHRHPEPRVLTDGHIFLIVVFVRFCCFDLCVS